MLMENKKLSVIIAAYNAAKTIEECIDSVFDGLDDGIMRQIEVIVVDDGSQDNTADIAAKFGDRIRLIRLVKNGGSVAKTRNVGLAAAYGEYITFLDSDDCYEKGTPARLFGYIEMYKPDIIRYGATHVYPDGSEQIPSYNPPELKYVQKKDFKKEVYPLFINGIRLNSLCYTVFRRNAADGVRFREEFRTGEDAAFAIEVYTEAQSVLFIPDRLYRYSRSGKGLTGSGLGIKDKFKYNFMLVPLMLGKLREWNMNTIPWRIRTAIRPFCIAADKLRRIK